MSNGLAPSRPAVLAMRAFDVDDVAPAALSLAVTVYSVSVKLPFAVPGLSVL